VPGSCAMEKHARFPPTGMNPTAGDPTQQRPIRLPTFVHFSSVAITRHSNPVASDA
jgi:hypothetical protein